MKKLQIFYNNMKSLKNGYFLYSRKEGNKTLKI